MRMVGHKVIAWFGSFELNDSELSSTREDNNNNNLQKFELLCKF